jgi:hypothetical protein
MNDRRFDLEDSLEDSVREQRWFAAMSAAKALKAECDVLRRVRDLADAEWQVARARLENFETLCDVLGEDLVGCTADHAATLAVSAQIMSVA